MIFPAIDPATLRSLRMARMAMSDARDLIDQGLPGAARVILPSALPADAPLDDDGRTRREHLPTDFPRIGGRDLVPGHTADFATPWWHDVFRPGERQEVFVGCCDGQKKLGRALRRSCYHVGIGDPGQAWPRIQDMKRRRYGAGYFVDGRYAEDDRNWSEWFLGFLADEIRPSLGSPVKVAERGILVLLPDTLGPADFSRRMAEGLGECSLARWLRTDEGRGHCAMLGIDPALGQRYTSPSVGSGRDPEPVEDIVLCAQWAAQRRVIHIAERIILAHVQQRGPASA